MAAAEEEEEAEGAAGEDDAPVVVSFVSFFSSAFVVPAFEPSLPPSVARNRPLTASSAEGNIAPTATSATPATTILAVLQGAALMAARGSDVSNTHNAHEGADLRAPLVSFVSSAACCCSLVALFASSSVSLCPVYPRRCGLLVCLSPRLIGVTPLRPSVLVLALQYRREARDSARESVATQHSDERGDADARTTRLLLSSPACAVCVLDGDPREITSAHSRTDMTTA